MDVHKEHIFNFDGRKDIEEARKMSFWKNVSGKTGIYLYIAPNEIEYPFRKNRIVYIGKAKDLAHRLHYHFTVDMKDKFIKDINVERLVKNEKIKTDALSWFYQNYFITENKMQIKCIEFSERNDRINGIERLFIGLFALIHGSVPLCNGTTNRKTFNDAVNNNRDLIECIINEHLG